MKYNFPKLPFIFSIILLIFSCFSLSFLYLRIKNTDAASTQILKEWQTENQKINDLKYLDHLVKSIGQERALLNTHFAETSNVVPFLNIVEKLASKAGTEVEVVFVNILEADQALSLQIKASGNFESVYKFLTLLENSPYEIEFISMDMQEFSADGTINSKKTEVPQWLAVFGVKLLSFIP